MKRALLVAGAAAFMAIGATTAASAASGTANGVTIGPQYSWAHAVNDHGDVTGDFTVGTGVQTEGFFWHAGKYTNLGLLPGGTDTEPAGINGRGDVVGEATAADGTWRAFVWSDGKLTDLGTSGVSSTATAINDKGQIIGTTNTADGQSLATIWRDDKATTLPDLGPYSAPVAENNAGLVVGYSETPDGTSHATVWKDGKLIDLGPGQAVAVNSSGQVLVWSYSVGTAPTVFLWQNGKRTDLPANLWSVTGLNDKGQVIGTYGSYGSEGFVWQNGVITNLGAVQPLAINDRGQIVTFSGTVLHDGTTTVLSPAPTGGATISDNGLVVGSSGPSQNATVWQVPAN